MRAALVAAALAIPTLSRAAALEELAAASRLSGAAPVAIASPSPTPVEPIRCPDYVRWTPEDYLKRVGGFLRFDCPDGAIVAGEGAQAIVVTMPLHPQRLLPLSSFGPEERDLIHKLARLMREPEYLARAAAKESAGHGLVDGVEIGAFLLTTKAGEVVTAVHTSNDHSVVGEGSAAKAYVNVLGARGLTEQDLAIVQYFHTHPSWKAGGTRIPGMGLSVDDAAFFEEGKKQLVQASRVAFRMYAIVEVGDTLYAFEMRAEPKS